MAIVDYSERTIKGERLIIFMALTYSVGFIFAEYLQKLGMVVSFVSVILFVYGYRLIKSKSEQSASIKSAYFLAFYSIVSLIVSMGTDYDSIRGVFLNPALILPYVCVLLATKRYDFSMPKIIIQGIEISAILFIVFSVLNFKEFLNGYSGMEAVLKLRENEISFDTVSKNFASCIGLGLLLAQYLKPRTLVVLITAFAINLLMAVFLGRRNIVFTNCLYLIAACYLYVKYAGIPSILKLLIITVGLSATIYGAINFKSFIKSSENPLFATLNERMELDTRGSVLKYYDKDMNSNPMNWIIGKGIDSTYYCPGIEEESSFRRTVEAGWRQIILKVGIIGFILYLLVLLPAVFKKKYNLLTEAFGIYICIGLIELYPAGVPTFYLQYILIWIGASICYDEKYVELQDIVIKSKILSK